MYLIVSLNVNGYNDEVHSLLEKYLELNPDIIFLSETKSKPNKLVPYLDRFTNYYYIINSNIPSCYHGVVMLINKRLHFKQLDVNLGIKPRRDTNSNDVSTGRIIGIVLEEKYNIIGTYVPNSGIEGIGYKYYYRVEQWDPALFNYLNEIKKQRTTIWIGDINVAPESNDVSNPMLMSTWAGFREQERLNFKQYIDNGWIDLWRQEHPNELGYSWGTSVNKMRLDNILSSKELLYKSFILKQSNVTDHAMIGVYIKQ